MTRAVRVSICFCLLLLAQSGWAACTALAGYADSRLVLDISDNDCTTPMSISFTRRIVRNQLPDPASMRRYSFESQCTLHYAKTGDIGGFACHARGRTPLAGATYRRKTVGVNIRICGGDFEGESEWRDEQPRHVYVCTQGCGKGAPARLHGAEEPCD